MKPATLPALRATGVALTVMEKAVQFHYERALRTPSQRSATWTARVENQLKLGLDALDRETPGTGWIGGEIGIVDITVACAYGFTKDVLDDVFEVSPYRKLAAFSLRAEDLKAFKAAPPVDGVTAPIG